MEELNLNNIREHVSQPIEGTQDEVEEIEQHLIQHLRTAGIDMCVCIYMYIYMYIYACK
jgi:hypothetical protein